MERSCYFPFICSNDSPPSPHIYEFAQLDAYMKPVKRELLGANQLYTIRGKGLAYPNTGKYYVEATLVNCGDGHGPYIGIVPHDNSPKAAATDDGENSGWMISRSSGERIYNGFDSNFEGIFI